MMNVILSAAKNLFGSGQMLRLLAQHDKRSDYVRLGSGLGFDELDDIVDH